jgi:hypothetical protein
LDIFGSLWHAIRRRIFSHITWPKKRRNLLVFQRKTPRPTVNTRADFRIEFGAAVESLLNAVSNVQGALVPPRGKNNLAVQLSIFLRRRRLSPIFDQRVRRATGARACGNCLSRDLWAGGLCRILRPQLGNSISPLRGIVSVSCCPRSFELGGAMRAARRLYRNCR